MGYYFNYHSDMADGCLSWAADNRAHYVSSQRYAHKDGDVLDTRHTCTTVVALTLERARSSRTCEEDIRHEESGLYINYIPGYALPWGTCNQTPVVVGDQ